MPFVPFLPILSVFINFYLMSILNVATWIRFAVWMALGNKKIIQNFKVRCQKFKFVFWRGNILILFDNVI